MSTASGCKRKAIVRTDSAPGGLVLFLEIVVCLSKSAQHFCRRLEQRLGSRIIDFRNVLAGVLCSILQHTLDIRSVMSRIVLGKVGVGHSVLLALGQRDNLALSVADQHIVRRRSEL